MKKKLYSAILASIMVIGSICGVAIPVYAKEETKIIDGNDSYDTATYLDINGSYSDVLADSDDVDFYKLTPDSNGKLSIHFGHTYGDSSDGWEVITYKYQDGEYLELSDTVIQLKDNENIELPFVGAQQGCEYYIKVKGYYGDAVNKKYTIKTTFTRSEQYEKEENNSYSSATEMGMNSTYTGTLNNKSDVDIYRIISSGDGKIALTFEHTYAEDSSGWNVIIYRYANGEYQELSNEIIEQKDSEVYQLPYIGAVSNGVYYVKITHYYWEEIGKEYVLRNTFLQSGYYEKEENDSYKTATDLMVGKVHNGTLNSNNDKDFWKITATKKGYIKLNFGHEYVDNGNGWSVSVYQYINGEYKELSSQTIELKDNKSLQLKGISAQAGNIYYIKITNYYWDAIGKNYTLKATYSVAKPYNLRGTIYGKKISLKWDRANTVNGFEVYCKVGNGKYKKIADTSKNSYTYKKLSKKKTCYFKVRSYIMNNGVKEYSSFSAVVKARAW